MRMPKLITADIDTDNITLCTKSICIANNIGTNDIKINSKI